MLINCPECSCSISEHAHMCPHCGFPLRIVSNDFEIQGDTLIKYIGGRYDKTIVIPNGVKRICESIFDDAYLEERVQVFIPKSVTIIDDEAFSFVNLIDITVDVDNCEYCSENGVLFNKRKTELIRYPRKKKETQYVVPDTVTTIKDYAFGACSDLETVQLANSLTDIEDSAFEECAKLLSITIPSNVRHIGERAFSSCNNLIDIIVSNSNSAYKSLDGVLFETHSMTLHSYPANKETSEYIIPDNVQTIGNWAFSQCLKLKSISVPQTVTRIGDGAFRYCENLKTINGMNGVTYIGKSAFNQCEKLKNVYLNDGIRIISRNMFWGCRSMNKITLPDSTVLIEEGAFLGCEKLRTIRIPPNTEKIKNRAFTECENLSTIRIPKNTDLSDDPFEYCDSDFRIIRY